MALSADRLIDIKTFFSDPEGRKMDLKVGASTTIYRNGFVGINATGYLVMYAGSTSDTTLTGNRFCGIALDAVDNSTGSDGDKSCQVLVDGSFYHALSSAGVLDIGAPVFASADNTLTKVAAGNAFVGWIESAPASGFVTVRMPGLAHSGTPLIVGVSPILDLTTVNDLGLVFPYAYSHNTILVLWAGMYVTTTTGATSAVVTLQSIPTAVTLGITFTSTVTGGDAALDIVAPLDNSVAIGAATGNALVVVPADKGVQAKVTTASETGAGKVVVIGVPI